MTQTQQAPEPAQALIEGDNSAIDAMVAESSQEAPSSPAEPSDEGAEQRLYAGKYKSVEEMEKGLLELQKKLGQKGIKIEEAPAETEEVRDFFTIEEASEIYGPSIAEAAERAGLNLAEWDQLVQAGGDTTTFRSALAAELGISEEVIANYENAFRPGAQQDSAEVDADTALKALAGGEQGWQRLTKWATENLSQPEIATINEALASQSPGVAEFAVKSLVARAQSAQEVEPLSGSMPTGDVFESEEAAMKSRFAKDERGRERYMWDERYRAAHDAKLARSQVFR